MEMSSERAVPANLATTWAVLNDPEALKACITGCERFELVAPDQYDMTMAVKVGPVGFKFKGKMTLSDVVPLSSYAIKFEGQGGMAGFAKGTAQVNVAAQGEGTALQYTVNAQVGGKLAQLGSRLIDSSAKKMADDFFEKLAARLTSPEASATTAPIPQ
ncbi:carbon monoxide dehydrogenase subunit G [soil metagenome]